MIGRSRFEITTGPNADDLLAAHWLRE